MGAENLCHQAILMNHAPSAVTPPDPEQIKRRPILGGLINEYERAA